MKKFLIVLLMCWFTHDARSQYLNPYMEIDTFSVNFILDEKASAEAVQKLYAFLDEYAGKYNEDQKHGFYLVFNDGNQADHVNIYANKAKFIRTGRKVWCWGLTLGGVAASVVPNPLAIMMIVGGTIIFPRNRYKWKTEYGESVRGSSYSTEVKRAGSYWTLFAGKKKMQKKFLHSLPHVGLDYAEYVVNDFGGRYKKHRKRRNKS